MEFHYRFLVEVSATSENDAISLLIGGDTSKWNGATLRGVDLIAFEEIEDPKSIKGRAVRELEIPSISEIWAAPEDFNLEDRKPSEKWPSINGRYFFNVSVRVGVNEEGLDSYFIDDYAFPYREALSRLNNGDPSKWYYHQLAAVLDEDGDWLYLPPETIPALLDEVEFVDYK